MTYQNGYYSPFYQAPVNYAPNNFARQENIMQPNVTQNQQTDIWVLNKNEADSYPVAPNCSVKLWDKSRPTFYVKSMGLNGVPNIQTFDFTERVENQNQVANEPNLNFVNADDFNALRAEVEELKAKYEQNDEKGKNQPKTNKGGE